MIESAVSFDRVSYSYDGRATVLQEVGFTIAAGQFVTIVGPNGGGKTTLFRLILGLLTPTSGKISIFGQRPEEARARIGYVPQHFVCDPLFPVRVEDVVRMGLLGPGPRPGKPETKQRIADALEQVGLGAVRRRWFSSLSGGQRQRVLIARALVVRPQLLLLDEPTSNVDAAAEENILTTLERLKGDLTILLITHHAGAASRFMETSYCGNRTVHAHPPTEKMDESLMRHSIGFSLDRQSNGGRRDG